MNPKIEKIIGDMEKTREKIAEHQSRLRELDRMKTELENADIVALVRGINIPPAEFEDFLRAFVEQRKNTAVPDGFSPPAGRTPMRASYAAQRNGDTDARDDTDKKEGADVEE
jgi:hypothetical protein